jgi:hypothetical protein
MSSLREIDRDLDQIAVDANRLADVQKGVTARGRLALDAVDAELAALGAGVRANGTAPFVRSEASRIDTEPPPPMDDDEGPPSGQIDVPDDVLKSSELPAVLALPVDSPPREPLSLDLEPGESPFDDEPAELPPIATSASVMPPVEAPAHEPSAYDPPTETRSLGDDPTADLASLLGESDPMREEGAAPIVPAELEPEPTQMFSAEDAERYSRPPAADEESEMSDVELELDEVIEIEDEPMEEEAVARPRTAPPPPPRTAPPPPPARPSEAPSRGFLGKLLQRKP